MIPQERLKKHKNYVLPDYYQVSGRGGFLVFILFLIFIVFRYLQGGYRFHVLGLIRFELLLGIFLFISAIPTYFNNKNRVSSGVGNWIVTLIICMVIMVFFSYVPDTSYDIFIERIIKFALIGFFIAAFVTTPTRLAWFLGAILFAYMKMGQEGLLGVVTGSMVWENQGIPRLHGSTPIYRHPNSFSGMALGCVPFLFYFYAIVPLYLKIILLIQGIFVLNIVLFTGSRTGYVTLALGIMFLIYKSEKRKQLFLFIIFLVIAAFQFIPEAYVKRFETIFTQKEIEGHSIDARKQILEDAWQIFIDNPLGVGVGAFPMVRQDRFSKSQDTHNLYLEIATNLGIQGIIAFFGFVFSLQKILSRLHIDLTNQIGKLNHVLKKIPADGLLSYSSTVREHLQDLRILNATCMSVYIFLIIRLSLGLFGMDLYEIYWWFALGTTVALWNMNSVAQCKTSMLYDLAQ